MKKFLTLFIGIIISTTLFAISYTSAGNGNWSMATTWTPLGVPQPGDDVTINHNVVMDDTYTVGGYWAVDAGSITIGPNGTFVQGTNVIGIAIQNGGTITNNGTISFNQIGIYQGTFTNNATANFYSLIYNLDGIENYGIIQEVDSFYTEGTVNNYANSSITTDSTYNAGGFINAGTFNSLYFTNELEITNNGNITFFNFTNIGDFVNNSMIIVNNDGTNSGNFTNVNGAEINLTRSFLNEDITNGDALFINDGVFNIGNSWSNRDTTRGGSTGEFHIQEGTSNTGFMKGTFLFCDNTPTVSVNPIIDYNTGTIESGITYCLTIDVTSFSNASNFSIYPNPAKDVLLFNNLSNSICKIDILDITGKVVMQKELNAYELSIDISGLNEGIYIVKINNESYKFIKN